MKSLAIAVVTLKGIQGDNQDEALCALGKQVEQALRYIGRKFYEPHFLHLPILRKAIKSLTKMAVPHASQQPSTKVCAGLHVPLFPNHIYADLP